MNLIKYKKPVVWKKIFIGILSFRKSSVIENQVHDDVHHIEDSIDRMIQKKK